MIARHDALTRTLARACKPSSPCAFALVCEGNVRDILGIIEHYYIEQILDAIHGPSDRVLAARSRCASNNIGFSRVALVVVAVVVVVVVASERRGEERRGEWGRPTAVEVYVFVFSHSAHTKVKGVHVHSVQLGVAINKPH
jgi:hypothetical protein